MASWEEFFEFKLIMAFPDAVIDKEAGTITLSIMEMMTLMMRHEWLEHGGYSNEPEPPKFLHYREGRWMDTDLP